MKLGSLFCVISFSFLTFSTFAQKNQTFADNNNTFGLELYKKLFNTEKNVFISPYSISSVMAMLYGGAKNETERQIQKTLHFDQNQTKTHKLFSDYNAQFTSRREVKLLLGNALWIRDINQVKPEYIQLNTKYYNSSIYPLTGAKPINDWAAKATMDKIKEVVSDQDVGGAEMVLTNAIYFQADWQKKFQKSNTKKDKFRLINGKSIEVDMMHQYTNFRYLDDPENQNQIIELPYRGDEISMYVILPYEKSSITQLSKFINTQTFNEYIQSVVTEYTKYSRMANVKLYMPKFSISTEYQLNDPLSAMGMSNPFSGEADFSNIITGAYLSFVKHKAVLQVDEDGTVAAAVTTAALERSIMEEIEFKINRPFMVFICDKPTGTALFIGSIINPLEK